MAFMRPKWLTFHSVQVADEAAFEVACFVFVNDVLFGKSVNHRRHLWELVLQLFGIGCGAVFPQSIPHSFVIVAVAETLALVGADALEG
jgi:hypothetical protein